MSFRKLRIRLFCLFVVLIFSVSCLNNRAEKSGSPDIYNENNSGSDIGTLEEIHLWNYKNPPEFQTAFLKNISDKLNISVWHTTATADNRPSAGEIGSFGIGNGSVFGFVGLNYP
ncbi:MAG: hypothetical protein N3B13_11375, partial [Deltaproteobacteria bacterium]|nr:hypothetical protein [Deltaproteobacteria bacterium]